MSSRNTKRLRRLLIIYSALAAAGLALGLSTGTSAQTPQQEMAEKVQRAIERIARESAEPEAEPDAGPEPAPPGERAPVVAFKPSPEPEVADAGPDGGLPASRRLPEPDATGGAGQRVLIIDIEDVIDMGLAAFVERTIEDNPDAAALILDINTPGGRVDAATLIRDAIMDAPKSMRTVAFINPRAISAGAFISLACDLIFISEGGSIGAATPIAIGGSGEAEAVDEKMVSYFRTEMASTARAKGRRGDLAEAMVDADVEIDGITPAGKLLTLDTAGALRWKMADSKAGSIDEVLEKLALGGATRTQVQLNWAEQVARVLTHPILSGILMSIGVLGILIELYQPGFGIPGIVGISCLVIFFAGHLVVHLAGWEEVLLFIIGVALLLVEIFVTPGFGVLGALGAATVLASLILAMSGMPLDVSFDTGELTSSALRAVVSLLIAAVLFAAALMLMPKTKRRNPLVLDTAIDATAAGGAEGEAVREALESGAPGVAETMLRPAGIARFGDRRIDVTSEGDFIESGEPVVIVRTEGNRVIVRREG